MSLPFARRGALAERAVATKAVLRAAARLGLSNKMLAKVIGVSEATVSRMGSGAYMLAKGDKPFDLAILLIRLFRALDTVAGGEDAMAAAWLRSENRAIGARPLPLS